MKIVLHDDIVFQAKLGYRAGKRRVAGGQGARSCTGSASRRCSCRRRHEEAGTPFEERDDVDHETFKAHGGSMPIRVGGELVGTITTSGEPDVVDHDVTSEAVRRFLAR